jgi:anti-sigma B factor antagonist
MFTLSIFEPERILSSAEGKKMVEWASAALSSGKKILLIDLYKTSFMDSSGLGSLVVVLKRVREHEGRLAICSLSGQASMLLEITELEKVFDIYATRSEFETSIAD